MIYVKKNIDKINGLVGKRVHFVSDCDIFPINVKGKVLSAENKKDETLIRFRVIPSNKVITIGSNMHNLRYELC